MCPVMTLAGTGDEPVEVIVDQAKIIKLPEKVATIVVGNPLIADVTLQPGGMVVVTGKGYGSTNMIAMDRAGGILADRSIQVEGPNDKLVTVFRGLERESYSCTPACQRRVTLGDGQNYFTQTLGQTGSLNGQASAVAGKP
ncbi:pilus assembly protein N-terminal domain-containing protein [Bradyrhizobium sp. G127]|uniref:pilus assembly protein N-terminal domain-containing protein n=1 Tax=Bradyrhizobium sp. G127 TaxID=2904800 RepID=UPI001F261CBA|nr:pilus assembly protein N-terminal domain-containing protein [Bradyrhizobium sp. G127]MCF2525267.1 pilus assembly protein N-terminal domain-containing protein [Bradyrhizobium sp. G127]